MRIVTICFAAAALVAATAAETGSSGQAARCGSLAVPARIAGKVVCLRYGSTCRFRHQARYLKFGFHCLGGYLDYDWRPLRRPLRVPTLAVGVDCPASAARRNGDGTALPYFLFGPGPAYPTLAASSGRASVGLTWSPTDPAYPGWAGTKVLWAVPRYAGAVLIRGRQLDGVSDVGFDLGPDGRGVCIRRSDLSAPVRPAPSGNLRAGTRLLRLSGRHFPIQLPDRVRGALRVTAPIAAADPSSRRGLELAWASVRECP